MTFPSGYLLRWRAYDWAQLIYALRGVMTVQTSAGLWVIPPHQAMWVPAGNSLRVEMGGQVSMRTLYLRPPLGAPLPATCRVVEVSALLRALLLQAVRLKTLDRRRPAQRHLIDVLLDQLAVLPLAPLDLPAPRDPRGVRAAALIRSSPERRFTLGEVAGKAGASPRTLERLFRGETGLAFGAWSQRARLLLGLQLLAEGRSVTRVSLAIGYESLSAFVAAFRRVFGTTPGRYFQAERRSEPDDISGPASGRGNPTGGSRSPSGFQGGRSPTRR
jgi:AraC-like DNA-binding protein